MGCAFWGFSLSFALLHLFPPLHLLVAGPDAVVRACVTKRRSSWACIGNPKPEQETIKGTHAQETSAYQRRPTSQHAAQGSNPPSAGVQGPNVAICLCIVCNAKQDLSCFCVWACCPFLKRLARLWDHLENAWLEHEGIALHGDKSKLRLMSSFTVELMQPWIHHACSHACSHAYTMHTPCMPHTLAAKPAAEPHDGTSSLQSVATLSAGM